MLSAKKLINKYSFIPKEMIKESKDTNFSMKIFINNKPKESNKKITLQHNTPLDPILTLSLDSLSKEKDTLNTLIWLAANNPLTLTVDKAQFNKEDQKPEENLPIEIGKDFLLDNTFTNRVKETQNLRSYKQKMNLKPPNSLSI